MRELVERDVVEMIGALERGERGKADEVLPLRIVRLAMLRMPVAALNGFVGASDFGLTTTIRPVATYPGSRLVGVG